MWPWLSWHQAAFLLLGTWAAWLALYALRPKRKRALVPFLPLWEGLLAPEPVARWLTRLRHVLSWVIASTLSALLIVPLIRARPGAPRSELVLLDAGQHMQASDVAPSRFERARQRVREHLAAADPADAILLAQLDTHVTPLSTLTRDRQRLNEALERAEVTDARTDVAAAVAFARQVLRGRPNPRLLLFSDGAFEVPAAALRQLRDAKIVLEQRRVGHSARNLALTRFTARRYLWNKRACEAMVEVENADDHAHRVELRLLDAKSAPIAVGSLEVDAHARARRFFPNLATASEHLQAQLRPDFGQDALASDDRAFALLPPLRRLRALLVSEGDRYLQAALLLDPALEIRRIAPGDFRTADGFDLAIFDRYTPERSPGVPSLYFGLPKTAAKFPFAITGEVSRPYLDDVAHDAALVRGLSLYDVNVASAARLAPQPGDRVIAADRRGTPLIVTGKRAGQPFVALSFELRATDLPLRAAWPVLLLRAIDQITVADVSYRPDLVAGVDHVESIPAGAARAWLQSPATAPRVRIPVHGGAALFRPLRTGLYELHAGADTRSFAVDRDPEANARLQPATVAGARHVPRAAAQRWAAFDAGWLALAWLILLVEWFAYQRRWTR